MEVSNANEETTMIIPVSGLQNLVSLADSIVSTRPHLPPLVIAVASADDCATARGFLVGYHKRLSDIEGDPLLPHALGAGTVLTAATDKADPDVALVTELADQLSATVPSGAGRWRPRLFQTCRDVIEAKDIAAGSAVDRRRELRDHLYAAWERRTPWLAWIQRVAEAGGMPGKVLGLVATAVFSGPNRWLFARALKGRRWRWFGDHVAKVNGLGGDFLTHALSLVPSGRSHDNVPLRTRILFDALLNDVNRFVQRRRFLPHRRRRRWTPVLTLDCTTERGSQCYALVQLFVELTERKPKSPLLMLAAVGQGVLESVAGVPNPTGQAVEYLQKYVDGKPSALPHRPWLPVLLTSEPTDPAAEDWLRSHHKVTPRVPGRVAAWAPVVAVTVLALAAAGTVTGRYLMSGCSDTWTNASGERVGVIERDCEFIPAAHADRFPDLQALEAQVADNNRAVDGMKDTTGAPRDYRKVVFFAPLTRPTGFVGRTAPANALWQLQGAVEAQMNLNGLASTSTSQIPVKLVLANSGDLFQDGANVASIITKQRQDGPGSLAAVIGISQSRASSLDAIGKLSDIPVIGSSMYGNHMTDENYNFFMAAPANDGFATKMADWMSSRYYTRAVIEYDATDTYFSKDLHDSLRSKLPGTVTLNDANLPEKPSARNTPASDIIRRLCQDATSGTLPVLTGRADQLKELLTAGDQLADCNTHTVTMLAGPGAIIEVASGDANKHKWLHLAYTALSDSADESEKATGNDALLAASAAINKTAAANGNNPSASGVLYQLNQPDFSVAGKAGLLSFTTGMHKDTSSTRIKINWA